MVPNLSVSVGLNRGLVSATAWDNSSIEAGTR